MFGYVEWCLGPPRTGRAPVRRRPNVDEATGAILARNAYNTEFGGQVAFWHAHRARARRSPAIAASSSAAIATSEPAGGASADRAAGRAGAGLDPCGALQVDAATRAGRDSRRVAFVLGQGAMRRGRQRWPPRTRRSRTAKPRSTSRSGSGTRRSAPFRCKTPDDSFDLIVNRWLLYQTLSCRIWARSGPYQPGGAFGFRDQLQDVLALLYTRPELCREHLLRAASRQFVEGDVQHWWHPPSGRGTRTRCSDDLLWLPYAVAVYVSRTGDDAVLDEVVPFLEAPALEPEQHEIYILPRVSAESASLFEHAVRAIDHALKYGAHGLPLIGSGDWNDGMNRVGHEGRGESVWLGWFLVVRAQRVRADLRAARPVRSGASAIATRLAGCSGMLELSWDGGWYRRAYFDDGTPLGSVQNDECRIDSLTQSWAVLSRAAEPRRARARDGRRARAPGPARRADRAAAHAALRPDGARSRATSRAICRACARTADSTRTRRCGRCSRSRASATATRRWSCSTCSIRSTTRARPRDVERYRVEPYVVAADVYAHPMHVGRGGWTWYTGSAGWMYQAAIEGLLGLRRAGATFSINPCIPAMWPASRSTGGSVATRYRITVTNPEHRCRGVRSAELDGTPVDPRAIPIADDGETHVVSVVLDSPVADQVRQVREVRPVH